MRQAVLGAVAALALAGVGLVPLIGQQLKSQAPVTGRGIEAKAQPPEPAAPWQRAGQMMTCDAAALPVKDHQTGGFVGVD